MKRNLFKPTLLAFVGAALVAASAQAQIPTNTFIIGFQQVGNATNVAGTVTLANFTSVQNFDLGTIDSGFATIFNNANWSTDPSILWGVSSSNNATDSTLRNYISSPETVGGNESPTLFEAPSSTSLAIQGAINGAYIGTTALYTNTPIAGSSNLFSQNLSTNTNSWQTYLAGGSHSFGADWTNYGAHATEANFGLGVGGMTLDIYSLAKGTTSTPGTDIGDFTLSYNGGDLMVTFTPDSAEAVPEPSTYALTSLGLVGALLVFLLRRRAARA
jgi:PEP-CTERM motif